MDCLNCKNKIKETDLTCSECGLPVKGARRSLRHNKLSNKALLKNKALAVYGYATRTVKVFNNSTPSSFPVLMSAVFLLVTGYFFYYIIFASPVGAGMDYSGKAADKGKEEASEYVIDNADDDEAISGEQAIVTGEGEIFTLDGIRYKGGIQAGRKTGFGVCEWPDGRKYEGEWANDKRHGAGIYSWPVAGGTWTYEGNWENDLMHGEGVITRPDGTTDKVRFNQGELTKSSGNLQNITIP